MGPAGARSVGLRLLRQWAKGARGEPFHKGIPHHPAIRQSKEYDIISSPQKSSHKKRCFHRVSSPGRDVVVCLTDSDAAPDVAWVEEMVEAQRRRLAKCLMFRSCEIGLLLLMEKMLHQLIHIVYTQYFCIYIYTHIYVDMYIYTYVHIYTQLHTYSRG